MQRNAIVIAAAASCLIACSNDPETPAGDAGADVGIVADLGGDTSADDDMTESQDMAAPEDAASDMSDTQDMQTGDAGAVDDVLVGAVLNVVNTVRSEEQMCGNQTVGPVDPLVVVDELSIAAQGHADDMAAMETVTFEGSDGSNSGDRVEATGWSGTLVNESIAVGQTNSLLLVSALMDSESTCMNLMAQTATGLGAGRAEASSGPSPYWSIVLGVE